MENEDFKMRRFKSNNIKGRSFLRQFSSSNNGKGMEPIPKKDIYEHLRRNFNKMKTITPLRYWRYSISYLTCCCQKRDTKTWRYEKFLA